MQACRHAFYDGSAPKGSGRGNRHESAVMAASSKEPLQVRIPTNVKRQFKALAALRGLEPNELFVEMWEQYEKITHASEEKTKE